MNASLPFFSVIIPTYNRAGLLKQALDSVFSQTWTSYEVTVVDDGSIDSTAGILRGYPKVNVLQQANGGPGPARNLGASHAQGDYLAFLDSDDLWFPWTLEIYKQVIEREKSPAFIAGKPLRFHDRDKLNPNVDDDPLQTESFRDYLASGDQWRWWGASSFVIRKDAFREVGGFARERMNGEDADLALRLGEAGGFVQVNSPFTFGYRDHAVSEMKNMDLTLAGARHQICAEKEKRYPGGPLRAKQRRLILTRHIRPISVECLRQGRRREGWELYKATLSWNLGLRKWKYLAGFPLKAWFSEK